MNKIRIVAHTFFQAQYFMRVNYLRRSDAIFVSDSRDLRGLRNCLVIFLEGWRHHPDQLHIEIETEQLKNRGVIETLSMKDDSLIGIDLLECGNTTPDLVIELLNLKIKNMREILRSGG